MDIHPAAIERLNRLCAIEQYSLPNYLLHIRPWSRQRDQLTGATLRRIAAEQQSFGERAGSMIALRHGAVNPGNFPFRFTSFHGVSFDSLAHQLVVEQEQVVDDVSRLALAFDEDPEVQALVEETLGSEKRHLENLRKLTARIPI